ncbi:MAG: hypothetical protein R3B48_17360 [Kofleriaceae bacterium]
MFASADPGCAKALSEKLGHPPPFTESELAALESLTVTHACDLSSLAACTGLRHLRVLASEVPSFDFCESLAELAHLEVLASRVDSFDGVVFCPALARIDLLYTSVSEAGDLLGVAEFNCGTIIGNPWNERSWSYLQSETAKPHMLVELPRESDWKLACTVWEKTQCCWGTVAGSQTLLVRPGLPKLTQNCFDALSLTSIRHELNQPTFTLEALFQEYASQVIAPDLAELAHARTLGRSEQALQWIAASTLSEDDQGGLGRFVQRFPSVPFYQASAALIELETKPLKLAVPSWYRAQRATLDGWLPNAPGAAVRFSAFALDGSPRADRVDALTYDLGLYPHGGELEAPMHAAGILNLGMCAEDPELFLAMRACDDDRRIFEYHFEDVSDAISEGRDVLTSIYPVFPSFAAMLDHVISLHPPGAAPIAMT